MDPYDLIRDRACIPVAESSPPVVTERWTYTRSWDIHWTLYGPNSTDNARAIKSALFMDYFTDALAGSQLFPVPDFPEPMRVPELIDAQWFDRSDFSIIAYEFVIETIIDQTVASVEVILNTEEGVAADFTVTA
jgi:hypothetical protein